LIAAAMLAACSSAPAGAGAAAAPADSLAGLEALFRERTSQTRSRYTDADVRFVSDMIGHHAQALVMSDLAATRSASPAVRALAARIRGGQEDEIALMQQWLRERGRAVPDPHAGHAHHHHVAMPGMLTAEQMTELERASGATFDRLFLTYMIEHHRGAIVMVDALFAADGAAQDPATFRLASDIRADQAAEISRMQRLLSSVMRESDSQ
jgi:uncharacterized protein (DUF305 family)